MPSENNIPQNEDKLLNEIKRLGLNKINNLKKFEKDADRYERALFNFLLYEYPPPDYIVLFDRKLEGKGEIERQLDVAVFKVPNFKTSLLCDLLIKIKNSNILKSVLGTNFSCRIQWA